MPQASNPIKKHNPVAAAGSVIFDAARIIFLSMAKHKQNFNISML